MIPSLPYSRAPIVEALLDIAVDLPGDFVIDALRKCQQKVKKEYPDQKAAQDVTQEISVGRKVSASTSSEHTGYIFLSSDKKRLFQAKRTGFTFNCLAPYPGWEVFFAEAQKLWEEYRRITHPRGYKRVALRYINRFDIPSELVNMETYFRTYPEVSRDLPQLMAGFFSQFTLPLADISSAASITQTMVESTKAGYSSVILDIDLYRTEALPAGSEMWPLFETLRIWKDKIFESCITEKARELIR